MSNLQKSIHPLAMSKLKGLLDLQEEIVNYKSEEEEEIRDRGRKIHHPEKQQTPKNHREL